MGGEPAVLADVAVGLVALASGAIAVRRRLSRRVGWLLVATGAAWLVGSVVPVATFLHRGFLIHLILTYPDGRLRSRVVTAVAAGTYGYAVVPAFAGADVVTAVVAAALTAAAACRVWAARGILRRACRWALAAAVAYSLVLALGIGLRNSGTAAHGIVLLVYELVVAAIAVWLVTGLRMGRWAETLLTGLVVDLGGIGDAGTLRDRLARALGDPVLVLGYWLPVERRYVDDAGETVALPRVGDIRVATTVGGAGDPLAVLVHDEAMVADPTLVRDIAAAARLAIVNARLRAEVRAGVAEVEASRRRIVLAEDAERRRLALELRDGAERHLDAAKALLTHGGAAGASGLRRALDQAREELRELARGIRPATLLTGGLGAALRDLTDRAPLPVDLEVQVGRLPAVIEAAGYFVCSEALANVAKHARASRTRIAVTDRAGTVVIAIDDDGAGGADPTLGSGLRGLRDRVEALGGSLAVASHPVTGTQIVAELPRG